MFVNETDLEGSSLDYAVHVLKSTGYGPVHIGVAKPLPVSEDYLRYLHIHQPICIFLISFLKSCLKNPVQEANF